MKQREYELPSCSHPSSRPYGRSGVGVVSYCCDFILSFASWCKHAAPLFRFVISFSLFTQTRNRNSSSYPLAWAPLLGYHSNLPLFSDVNRPVRPGSLQTGTDGKVAVRPRAGRKRRRLFEAGRGRTAMTAK
jgi:hypothetical protein